MEGVVRKENIIVSDILEYLELNELEQISQIEEIKEASNELGNLSKTFRQIHMRLGVLDADSYAE